MACPTGRGPENEKETLGINGIDDIDEEIVHENDTTYTTITTYGSTEVCFM